MGSPILVRRHLYIELGTLGVPTGAPNWLMIFATAAPCWHAGTRTGPINAGLRWYLPRGSTLKAVPETSTDGFSFPSSVPACGGRGDDQESLWGICLDVLRDPHLLLNIFEQRNSIHFNRWALPWSWTPRETISLSWSGESSSVAHVASG